MDKAVEKNIFDDIVPEESWMTGETIEHLNVAMNKYIEKEHVQIRAIIIDGLEKYRDKVSRKLRQHGDPYIKYKNQRITSPAVIDTANIIIQSGCYENLILYLSCDAWEEEVGRTEICEMLNALLVKWMSVDKQLWVPYEWERVKDPRVLEELRDLAMDYCLSVKELTQIIELIEKKQREIQIDVHEYIEWRQRPEATEEQKKEVDYNKKHIRTQITNFIIDDAVNHDFFDESMTKFLIDPTDEDREDHLSCELILEKFFKRWLLHDKRIWDKKKLEQTLNWIVDKEGNYKHIWEDPEDEDLEGNMLHPTEE